MNKIQLASLPTPVYLMEMLSKELGRNIWIKRDDFTGVEFTGNKVRKLEYLFGDAREKDYNCVLTRGGKQSNHARATAAIAARLGFSCVLFLEGTDDGTCEGNLLLDRMFGAKVIFYTQEELEAQKTTIEEVMDKYANEHKAYLVPLGGSTSIGARGYTDCMREIEDYERLHHVYFDVIAQATGSGGTYAGLLIGNSERNIVGYSCSESAGYFTDAIYKIVQETHPEIPKSKIKIVDEYRGPEYGKAPEAALERIVRVAQTEGVVMDTCYTGKAFYGLVSDIQKGAYDNCNDILFIHTGGIFSIFADEDLKKKIKERAKV